MLKFNIKLISTFVLSTLLAACSLPTPQQRDSQTNNSNFYVDNASGELLADTDLNSFSLPQSRSYNFSVCMTDKGFGRPIQNQNFTVKEANLTAKTDLKGCLNWKEKINFNFLAQSQFVQIDRNIQAQGLFKGSETVSFAINPWSHGESITKAYDLRKSTLNKLATAKQAELALLGVDSNKKPATRTIWVEDGRLSILQKSYSELIVDARLNVTIKLNNMSNEVVLVPLKSGNFKARVRLVQTVTDKGTEVRREITQSEWTDAKISDGNLSLRTSLKIDSIPTDGLMAMALELTPKNAPVGLSGFEGVYILGDYEQIKTNAFLKVSSIVSESSEFKVDNYITAALADKSDKAATSTEALQKAKIEVMPLEFKYVRVGQESTSEKEVFVNIKACLKNGIDQKPIRSRTFKITRFNDGSKNPEFIEIKSDNNACLNWDDAIKFKHFECQHFIKGQISISNEDLKMNETLAVAVNPWETWGSMARDMRYVDNTEKLTLTCKQDSRLASQLIIDTFTYNTSSFSYDIDNALNLTVKKKVTMRIDPKVVIYNSLSRGRGDDEKIRDGLYALKAVIVNNLEYNSTVTPISFIERVVPIVNGSINTEVEFKATDIKALDNRNNIIISVQPINEEKFKANPNADINTLVDNTTGLVSNAFIGNVFLGTDDQSSRQMRLMDEQFITNYFTKSDLNAKDTIGVLNKILADAKESLKKSVILPSKKEISQKENLQLIDLSETQSNQNILKSFGIQTSDYTHVQGIKSSPEYYQAALARAKPASNATLLDLINKKEINPETARKLCIYWFNNLMTDKKQLEPFAYHTITSACVSSVMSNPEDFFIKESRIISKEVGKSIPTGATNHGFNVGTSFYLSTTHSAATAQSISGSLGFSWKFLEFFSLGSTYSVSSSKTDSVSSNNSINIGETTSLSVTKNNFKIEFKKFEQCAVIKLNPSLFADDKTSSWYNRKTNYSKFLNQKMNVDQKLQAISQGLMICSGVTQNSSFVANESYYIINQDIASAKAVDMGDPRNRKLFMVLRGNNDYKRFIMATRSQHEAPKQATAKEDVSFQQFEDFVQLMGAGSSSSPGSLIWR